MRHRLGVGLLVTTLAAGGTAGAYAQDYKVLQRATLGGEGGWDLLAVDAVGHRLYVARGTRVMVIDAETLKLVGEIPDTAGVHGVAVASDLGRGFTSNGRTSNSTIFDLKTLAKVGEVKTGENPDAILYEPKSHRVLAFNGRSKDVTVIDAKAGTVAGTVLLEGQPELAVDDGTGTVFVNLEDKSEVVALDPVALKVKARWPLAPCEEPTGLAIDRAHRRLFAACANKMMAVMNADSGKVVTTDPRDLPGQVRGGADGGHREERPHDRSRSQDAQALPRGRAVRAAPVADDGAAEAAAGDGAGDLRSARRRTLAGPRAAAAPRDIRFRP